MPRLQDENNRVWNAMNEGVVVTVITLYDRHEIGHGTGSRYDEIRDILVSLKMDQEDIDYWLDYYHIS